MAQEVINDDVYLIMLSSHTVPVFKTLIPLYKAVTTALCVEATALRLAAQFKVQTGVQGRTGQRYLGQ